MERSPKIQRYSLSFLKLANIITFFKTSKATTEKPGNVSKIAEQKNSARYHSDVAYYDGTFNPFFLGGLNFPFCKDCNVNHKVFDVIKQELCPQLQEIRGTGCFNKFNRNKYFFNESIFTNPDIQINTLIETIIKNKHPISRMSDLFFFRRTLQINIIVFQVFSTINIILFLKLVIRD
ncbi:hypothetical protein EDEG_00437 [Edhazardia aedis USNM 41457]|uniref:Uncharacterized protein n=1 Tax=Edhazardia aedis (strain USNM 41457) TaxID=1003232 RepID=J9DJD9_EDHAE|nr:hypothetical protein EDEG_00437 [Edhazardia aedis USNM 41457]|eukprot:EJW01492.1 hypothetical protein EDEG_00437 [Edhazardia aedis USNM 41457]